MNLKGNSVENLNTSFNALETFLGDQTTLEKVRELLKHGTVSEEQRIVLNQIEKTLKCYIVESNSAKALRESMMKKEGGCFTEIQEQLEDAIHGQGRKRRRYDADSYSNQNAFGSRGKCSQVVLGNAEEKWSVLIG